MIRNRWMVTVALAGAGVVGVSASAVAAEPAQAPAAKAASSGWRMYKTLPSSGTFWNTAASSWGNAWAVGTGRTSGTPLAWRWNGHKWAQVAMPSGTTGLSEVSTSGVHNTLFLSTGANRRLIKWNNGKWTVATAAHSKGVYHVAAAGARQIWGAGDGFMRHYDGAKWHDSALPAGVTIADISVNHYNDVWAVGYKKVDDNTDRPFAMHWNGSSWHTTSVPNYTVPNADQNDVTLDSVAFLGGDDVYASGNVNTGERVDKPILVHWNGTKWSKVTLPSTVKSPYASVGVTPVGGGGIWYGWANRHILRRASSGHWTDYTLPSKSGPAVEAIAHIPGSKTSLAVGVTTGSTGHPFIALGR